MKQIRHTGIVVSSLEDSLVFYRDLLGLSIHKDNTEKGSYIDKVLGLSGVEVRTVKLKSGDGNLIELLQYNSPKSQKATRKINDIGYSHIAFSVDDIEKSYAELKSNGVVFNGAPCVSPDAYAKVAFCRDPDGNFIELVEQLNDDTLDKRENKS